MCWQFSWKRERFSDELSPLNGSQPSFHTIWTNELPHLQLKSTKKNQNIKRLMVPFISCLIIKLSCGNHLGTISSHVWKKSFCLNLKIRLHAYVYVMYDTYTHIFARVFFLTFSGGIAPSMDRDFYKKDAGVTKWRCWCLSNPGRSLGMVQVFAGNCPLVQWPSQSGQT